MRRAAIRIVLAFLAALCFPGAAGLQAQWIKDGAAICPSPGDQWYGCLTPDGAGGAIITWFEIRSGVPSDFDIYAQRIDRSGSRLWASDGVSVSVAPGAQADPRIAADGGGGAVIAWRDERNGTFDIYAQRIDAAGHTQWASNGVPVVAERHGQILPSIARDGRGGFIIAWADDRDCNRQIYCQKLDGSGNALWAANGIAVCPTIWWQDQPAALPDGSGGAIIVWEDDRDSFLNSFVYAQRIGGNGNKLWAPAGAYVTVSSGFKRGLRCIEDGCGGAYVAWSVGSDGEMNICAQRIDSTGALWMRGDAPLCTAPRDQDAPAMTLDGAGGAIIAWHDRRDSCDNVYAQRIAGAGDVLWTSNGVPIRTNPPSGITPWTIPQLVSDGAGGAIVAWQWGSGTCTEYDIFAQRIDHEGSLLWPDTGVAVCCAPEGQYYPQMISNGEGGAIVTWRDLRDDTIGAVYAMRVTANGETVATLLQSFAARAQGPNIVIEWSLAEIDPHARFIVLRATMPDGSAGELAAAELRWHGLSCTCIDRSCESGLSYRYRIDVESEGKRYVLFETLILTAPHVALSLHQNHPNPFNPTTTIRYDLSKRAHVRLDVFDCAGRHIARIVDEEQESGSHAAEWNGADAVGSDLKSGVYFYRLTAGKEMISRKMVLLR